MIMDGPKRPKRRTLHVPNGLIPIWKTKLSSSTVDLDDRTLPVLKLIRGEEKYYPNCLK